MARELDKNELFYEKYLTEPVHDTRGVVTGLGLATFPVLNQELIDGIKKATDADVVEGEFSFVRNKLLHYKPCMDSGAASAGILTFRVCKADGISKIQQCSVTHNHTDNKVYITSFNNDGIVLPGSGFDADHHTTPALTSLANIIAEAFNAY